MPITYPSDLSEDSWTQFVARLLSTDAAGGKPLRGFFSTHPGQDLRSMGVSWDAYTDHDSETSIGVGQVDILIKSPVLRTMIENKLSAPSRLSPARECRTTAPPTSSSM